MKIVLDCVPCFFKQALRTARMLDVDENLQEDIVNELCRLLPEFEMNKTPPEMGEILYSMIGEKTGLADPFKTIKEKSNRFALNLYPRLKEKIAKAEDPLFAAVKMAIFGNIIDFGAVSAEKIDKELKLFLSGDNKDALNSDSDFNGFVQTLEDADTILYLGDNCGEIVFDCLLIEELLKYGKKITFAVRGKPAINDVLMKDAEMVGLTKIVPVISNGTAIPGTVLSKCSHEFVSAFEQADIIISKGQGNYETLSNEKCLDKIFFMLKVKCSVVANQTGEPVGTMILKRMNYTG